MPEPSDDVAGDGETIDGAPELAVGDPLPVGDAEAPVELAALGERGLGAELGHAAGERIARQADLQRMHLLGPLGGAQGRGRRGGRACGGGGGVTTAPAV